MPKYTLELEKKALKVLMEWNLFINDPMQYLDDLSDAIHELAATIQK